MSLSLKPIHEQTIVISGATSGIGLVTARLAAEQGANVVLAARNADALTELEREINGKRRGQAVAVVADVANEADVRNIAERAISRFGGFDTWVNNAGCSIFGRIEQTDVEDARRVFDTNFWGVYHGSRAAMDHLKHRTGSTPGAAGAIINVGSTVSDRAIPLQGVYSASKFAVRALTDALRMEIEEAGYSISVTLIKPAAIDTPYLEHAKNLMDEEPSFPPPIYAPETVAHAILHAAQTPRRDIFVGAGGKIFSLMEKYAPRLTDRYMEQALFRQQKSGRPATRREDGLHSFGRGLMERGGYEGRVMESSLYTQASLHPWMTGLLIGAAGAAVAALVTRERD